MGYEMDLAINLLCNKSVAIVYLMLQPLDDNLHVG